MDKDQLNRYFDGNCSPAESKAVGEWISDPDNRAEFERFLETRWDTHTDQLLRSDTVAVRRPAMRKWWPAAAAALAAVAFCLYYYGKPAPQQERHAAVSAPPRIEQTDRTAIARTDTFQSGINAQNSAHHERKAVKNKPAPVLAGADPVNRLAKADTTGLEKRPAFVKSSKLGNFMVNKAALSQLRDKIESDQLVLNLDVHEITFQRLAVLLYQEYGIRLEPCDSTGMTKTYTARFEKVSLPDLLNDMSEKMLFSYSLEGNTARICFN